MKYKQFLLIDLLFLIVFVSFQNLTIAQEPTDSTILESSDTSYYVAYQWTNEVYIGDLLDGTNELIGTVSEGVVANSSEINPHIVYNSDLLPFDLPYSLESGWIFQQGVFSPDGGQFVYGIAHIGTGDYEIGIFDIITNTHRNVDGPDTDAPLIPLGWTSANDLLFAERLFFRDIHVRLWTYNQITNFDIMLEFDELVNQAYLSPDGISLVYQQRNTQIVQLNLQTNEELRSATGSTLLGWVDRETQLDGENLTSPLIYETMNSASPFLYWPTYETRSYSREYTSTHRGVDIIKNGSGFEIVAASNGRVVQSGPSEAWTLYGDACRNAGGIPNGTAHVVILEHSTNAGIYYTIYLHSSQEFVSANQNVIAGQRLSTAGNTGCSSGIHLHFEVRKGSNTSSARVDPKNPRIWIGGSDVNDASSAPQSPSDDVVFDFTSSRHGFREVNMDFHTHADGGAIWLVNAPDPWIDGPITPFNAAYYDALTITMATFNDQCGQFYWIRSTDTDGFQGERRIRLNSAMADAGLDSSTTTFTGSTKDSSGSFPLHPPVLPPTRGGRRLIAEAPSEDSPRLAQNDKAIKGLSKVQNGYFVK